ncbi:MAG: hypothetical protein N2049_05565 [Anaerolineales bacterium]|nr:hypothetical protein [Anaerolineales bacterium]MCX7608669.1 hypothetical protein [Anaerolineales bacterium]
MESHLIILTLFVLRLVIPALVILVLGELAQRYFRQARHRF